MNKKQLIFALAVVISAAICSFGCGGGNSSTRTLVPVDIEDISEESGINTNSAFDYTFTNTADISTITASTFYLVEGANCNSSDKVAATVGCIATALTCRLSPSAELDEGTVYTVCLIAGSESEGIRYTDGTYFEGYEATFTTEGASAVTVSFSPEDSSMPWVKAVVTATFSDAITEPAGQTAWLATFTLKQNTDDAQTACTSITYDDETKTATCVHDMLEFNSEYTVAVNGITDSEGATVPYSTITFITQKPTFGGFDTNANMLWFVVDEPFTGQISFHDSEGGVEVDDYAKSGNYYSISVAGSEDVMTAWISKEFAVLKSDASGVLFGILIDPTDADVFDASKGRSYGGMALKEGSIGYWANDITEDGTITTSTGNSLSEPPSDTSYSDIEDYIFNEDNYFFSTSPNPNTTLQIFKNRDGHGVALTLDDGDFSSLLVMNESPADGTIPSGVDVGDEYNGYVLDSVNGALKLKLTITDKDETSLAMDIEINETVVNNPTLSHVTTEGWPAGFYKYNYDGIFGATVIRFLDANTILITDKGGPIDPYSFGLAIK